MCGNPFSKPDIPAPLPPPPPPPEVPKVEMGTSEDKSNKTNSKKLGTARLQIPLTSNTKSGLGI